MITKHCILRTLLFISCIHLIIFFSQAYNQVPANSKRYIRIGSLQNHYSAYGSERAWNNSYYEGLIWPADYKYQDNAVIKRSFLGCQDFVDQNGLYWSAYGFQLTAGFVDEAVFPVELKQSARFEAPTVIVDGINISAPLSGDVDEINPNQIPDRIVTNIINTSMGLTMNRTIYAFSQQYHDNYHIKIYTFTNTGNTDYDAEIERHGLLSGVRVGWGIRYSVCREGSYAIGGTQSWGQHDWVTKRGEDNPQHANDPITLADPIVEWIRCGFIWAGQSESNSFDNIGGPYLSQGGRLTAPQHAGVAVLHVDSSSTNNADNPYQPLTLGWHAGDTYPGMTTVTPAALQHMILQYSMLSGNPIQGLGGNERFWETYHQHKNDPWKVHNDGGGTNIWINYGPFDLQEGESFTIVEAEGVNGLSRTMCETIGHRWKQAYDDPNDPGPFVLPDGTITNDENVYKNEWVYTGRDSILLTFSRAKRNYDLNFQIPQPPLPPPLFEVESCFDTIKLSWAASPSEGEPDFAGYRLYRAVNKPDTAFTEIFSCGPGTGHPGIVHNFNDIDTKTGVDYYYYIVSCNNGSNNVSQANPQGSLHSNKFYTRTTEPASILTDIKDQDSKKHISSFYLAHNFPNPFNPNTTIQFDLPKASEVSLKVFNILGEEVTTLVSGKLNAGSYSYDWDAGNLASGVYLYRLEAGGFVQTHKMILIR